MKPVLQTIQHAFQNQQKLLAILIDPDKVEVSDMKVLCKRIAKAKADFIFIGGSTVDVGQTERIAHEIKKNTLIPLILFPGDYTQLTNNADALLFLNLISGDNPHYLIQQQVKSVLFLESSSLEVISTGYILIDGGTITSTMKVSQTNALSQHNIQLIQHTAKAGELMGQQLIYLEAGSGAINPVSKHVVNTTFNSLNIPIIVGGGIRTSEQIQDAYHAGATLVVVGTAFENNEIF